MQEQSGNLDQFKKDIDSEKAKERVDSDHAHRQNPSNKHDSNVSSTTNQWREETKLMVFARQSTQLVGKSQT
jgi:hypothetical protein